MPRPRLRRWVAGIPKATYFKPQGIPLCELVEIRLPIEGLEALRLADLEGLTAEAAATGMGVSRHTFGRVLSEARASVARALVGGAALRIDGGHFEVAPRQDAARLQTAQTVDGGCVVAVPSQGPTLDSLVDPRCDRAAGFTLVNLADMSFQHLENTRPAGRGRGAVMHFLQNLRDAGANSLLASPPHPGFLNAVSRAGLCFIEHVPMSMEETVGEAVGRLVSRSQKNSHVFCE